MASLRTVFSLDRLGDSERISCVLRLPRTNVSLGRTELFHKYPTKYPARYLSLPYTSSLAVRTAVESRVVALLMLVICGRGNFV